MLPVPGAGVDEWTVPCIDFFPSFRPPLRRTSIFFRKESRVENRTIVIIAGDRVVMHGAKRYQWATLARGNEVSDPAPTEALFLRVSNVER
jgi:hypothetical protein